MTRQTISTPRVPSSVFYSQGLRFGNLVFVSGQGPWRPGSDAVVGDSIEEQTAVTLDNIRTILETAGARMADVAKVTVHLSDMQLWDRFNEVYARYFPEPRPTRTTVESRLAGFMVEIDVIAVTGGELKGAPMAGPGMCIA